MHIIQNRRRFMAGIAAGAAGLVAAPRLALAEPAPETTKVRLPVFTKVSDCQSPMYAATEPQEVLDRGTDWRFLKELKREMKT